MKYYKENYYTGKTSEISSTTYYRLKKREGAQVNVYYNNGKRNAGVVRVKED